MKKIFIAVILTLIYTATTMAQDGIQRYFEKYMDDDRFTVVYISPKMFEMFSKIDPEQMDRELKDAIKGIKGLRILTTDHGATKLYEEALTKFDKSDYETLMTVKSEEDNIQFYVKESNDVINELLLLVGGDEFVLMSFVGNIDLKTISRLANSMDLKGVHHLEKMEENEK